MSAALAYIKREWHVFPLHTPLPNGQCDCRKPACENVGKHPRTRNGLKDATVDEAIIRGWWHGWPTANIAIACGPSRLVALDVDPRHGGDESLADLKAKHGTEWLDTATSLTGGGGGHYVFRAPVGRRIANSSGLLGPGLDIRGDGGYIVAPPSLHASGRIYEWERTVRDAPLLDLPAWAVELLEARRPRDSRQVMQDGQRNVSLTSFLGAMRARGAGYESMLAAAEIENARHPSPMSAAEVQKIARSVAGYPAGHEVLVRVQRATYERLHKLATEPPSYELVVTGVTIRLTMTQLVAHRTVRMAIAEQADLLIPRLKETDWDEILADLIDKIEHVESPEDASEPGILWAITQEYLRGASETAEDFAHGQPLERDGWIHTTGRMLRQALISRGIVRVDQRALWAVAVRHGAEKRNVRINNRQQWAWGFPADKSLDGLEGDTRLMSPDTRDGDQS